MSTKSTHTAIESYKETVDPTCYQTICDAHASDKPGLVDALPAMGKSRGIPLCVAETGEPYTVYTLRHDLYRQFEESCEELGLRHARIPSQRADCPLGEQFKHTHGKSRHPEADKWESRFQEAYKKFRSFVVIHEHYGDRLPCQAEGPCPYILAREEFHEELGEIEKGNAEPYDVIIGNYLHAFTPYTVEVQKVDGDTIEVTRIGRYHVDRYVAFDEFPWNDAVQEFDADTVQESVTNYLKQKDELPFKNYSDLMEERKNPEYRASISSWLSSRRNRLISGLSYHQDKMVPEAPLLIELLLSAGDPLSLNKYLYAELGDEVVGAKSGDKGSVWLLARPPLKNARGVIALDGTPPIDLWNLFLPEIEHYEVLPTDEEKQAYVEGELGIRLLQTSAHPKPYAAGNEFDPDKPSKQIHGQNKAAVKDILAFKWMIDSYEGTEAPAIISTKAAIEAYEREEPLCAFSRHEHYNNLIGTNAFAECRFGIVAGCNYPGDEVVKMWAALCGRGVEPETNDKGERLSGRNLNFGEFGNRILHAVRENDVLQAVMRFGRSPGEDGNRGATVYVHTSALPEWVQPEVQLPRVHLWESNNGTTDVLSILREFGGENTEWTVPLFHDVLVTLHGEKDAVSKRTVRRELNRFAKQGIVKKEDQSGEGAGKGSAPMYIPDNLSELIEFGPGYVLPPIAEEPV